MRATAIVVGAAGQSPLVGRLHPDPDVARHAAFALFALVYLRQAGLVHGPLRDVEPAPDAVQAAVAEVAAQSPHLFRFFSAAGRAAALGQIDPGAAHELIGWTTAQHVEREEPQIAYELGMLALGVELPGILVGSLRELELGADSTVVELPDGSGYPTVFLATLHPQWGASHCAHLFVGGTDAEQLASWAMILLTRSLVPPPGSIIRVSADQRGGLLDSRYDVALVYNPVPWLDDAAGYERAVRAEQVIVL